MSADQLRFEQKLRNRMLLYILTCSAGVLAILGMVVFYFTENLISGMIQNKARCRVEVTAAKIDHWLDARGRAVEALALSLSLEGELDESRRVLLAELKSSHHALNVYLGLDDGRFLTDSGARPAGFDPRLRPWYQQAMAKDGLVYTTPYRDILTGEMVITLAVPLRHGGRKAGVLGMDVATVEVQDEIRQLQPAPGGSAAMIDADGLYVLHPNEKLILNGKIQDQPEGVHCAAFLAEMAAGRPDVVFAEPGGGCVVFSDIPSAHWQIVYRLPAEIINAPLRQEQLIFALGALAALLVLAVVINLVSGVLSGPILTLADGARAVAGGDYSRRVNVGLRDEIGYLAHCFNQMAAGLLERERIRHDLVESNAAKERLDSELNFAKQIQLDLLPKRAPAFALNPQLDLHAAMRPAREVGGDLYDYFPLDSRRLVLVVGDVSDKGMPAALFMTMTKSLLKAEALRGAAPGEILTRVNALLCQENESGMFVTVFLGVLDVQTGELDYALGGHLPPLLRRLDGRVEELTADGIALGVVEEVELETRRARLDPGDLLLIFTDGVTEAQNPADELYGDERLRKLLARRTPATCVFLIGEVLKDVHDFCGERPQFDDIALLALRFKRG